MSHRLPKARKVSMFNKLSVKELNMETWDDFAGLFGQRGACGGCWCMYWRLRRKEYELSKGDGNKQMMKRLAGQHEAPGLLLYAGGKVAGWCSVGPRENFPVLMNSGILKPVDEMPVWSIVCFFIAKEFRRMGLMQPFILHVIEYCRKHGATIVEGYPLDVASNNYPVVFAHVGFYSAYSSTGFKEVARRSETRPIMRFYL